MIGTLNFKNNSRRKRLAHGGSFGMGVHPDWRGRGIGEALLRGLLDWAQANPQIEKVSLAVLADNAAADGDLERPRARG